MPEEESSNADSQIPRRGWNREPLAEIVVGIGSGTKQPTVDTLAMEISPATLPVIYLNPRASVPSGTDSVSRCFGGACPRFRKCAGVLSGISACWNRQLSSDAAKAVPLPCIKSPWDVEYGKTVPSDCGKDGRGHQQSARAAPEGWAGQVMRLQRVYVDAIGRVFNATHRFDFGGCPLRGDRGDDPPAGAVKPADLGVGARLLVLEEMVNLMVEPQAGPAGEWVEYEEVVLKLPLFLSLAPLMDQLLLMPWAVQHRRSVRSLWHAVLGVPLAFQPLRPVAASDVLFVENLYQPLLPPCGTHSAAQWQLLRSNYLLPLNGLPMLEADGRMRDSGVEPVDPLGGANPLSRDWVVVVADLGLSPALEAEVRYAQSVLERLFTPERVVEYHGRMSVEASKQLFNRALLLVAFSGPALVNTAFLPYNASVLELLPGEQEGVLPEGASGPAPDTFQSLARACGVAHYAFECPGARLSAARSRQEEQNPDGLPSRKRSRERNEQQQDEDVPPEGPKRRLLGGNDEGASSASHDEEASAEAPSVCDREVLEEVLESIQHHIFKSPWFDPEWLDRTGEGYSHRIPGTVVRSKRERAGFNEWLRCVSTGGRWAKDLRPRMLAWEYNGTSNYCERRWAKLGGFYGRKADDWVLRGGGAGGWQVRPSAKYVWMARGCGMWAPFSGERFCRSAAGGGRGPRGRTVLILGDSLQEQFVRTFVNNLVAHIQKPAWWAVHEHVPPECYDWLRSPKRPRHNYCRVYRLDAEVCRNLTVTFIRNDHLQISGNQHAFDRQPFVRMAQLPEADIVVLNRGAHYRANDHFTDGLRSAVRHIRNRLPDAVLIFRSTAPGHANCTKSPWKPLKVPQDPRKLPDPYRFPYMWDKFEEQNEIARQIIEEVGGIYMDVNTMTSYRADGHQGLIEEINLLDCLHYCMPGPLDGWAQLLFNILLKVVPTS